MLVAPFLRPSNGVGDTPPLPYYLSANSLYLFVLEGEKEKAHIFFLFFRFDRYCLIGIAIMILGIIYWAVWRVVLPKIFGYKLVPNKAVLDDGTVVNVVCSFLSLQRWKNANYNFISF